MAAPTVVEVLTDEGANTVASVTTAAGTAVDDIIVVFATDNYYAGYNNPSQPSGVTTWAHIVLVDQNTHVPPHLIKHNAWWGKVTASGAKTINVSPSSDEEVYLSAYVLRGADPTSPVDVFATAEDSSLGSTIAIPIVTTTDPNTRVINSTYNGTYGGTPANFSSVDSPWTEEGEVGNAFGRAAVASYAKVATGATSAANWNLSSSSSGPSITVAIRSATASQGVAAFSVEIAVAGTGDAPGAANGVGALGVAVTVAGTGARPSQGVGDISVPIEVAGSGLVSTAGIGAIAVEIALDGTGDAPSLTAVGVAAFTADIALFAYGAGISRITPVRILTAHEILTGNRNTKFYLDVLDSANAPLARLDGVTDGKLDWIANVVIKGAGSLTVIDVDQDVDWLNARLRPVMVIEGLPIQPLGVFMVSEAPENWGGGRSWSIKLLDNTTILDQDTVAETYALNAGTVVTTTIRQLIESAGITNHSVTSSTATVAAPLVWSAGTSKLRIVNDLLALIGYFSLFSNFDGQYVARPYVLPAKRPLTYEFVDGPESIYEPRFNRDNDIWSIPNRVTIVGVGDGTTAALTSTIDNNDATSPYSIASRGRVIGHTETGVEAASQTVLNEYAKKRLVELTSPTSSVEIAHMPVPGLAVNQAARFRRTIAGIDARHVVSKTSITLDGKALATSTLREVVDL